MSHHWQSYSSLKVKPPAPLAPWLLDPASFMQRLRRHNVQSAGVQVMAQEWQFPSVAERAVLALAPRHYSLVREVVINSPHGKWMFARTIIPRDTLTGREQLLGRLKNRAIGTVLFNHQYATRGEFEFTLITPGDDWHEKIKQLAGVDVPELWARRSVFSIRAKTLLLCEVFFPDLMEL